jgi:tetratricopeptide (TPR) repeat protein
MPSHCRLGTRFALPTLVLLLTFTPAPADHWPVARGPSREPVPYRYDPACWKQVPKTFLEDASACILYSSTTHLVEPDGTIETITHELTRLSGRKGIDKLGEYHNITYAPAYQKLTLNVARVHKPGGQIVPIEPAHVQLRDQSTDYQVYDHDKQLVISFPNLEVGDVYEVKWTVRGRNPEHAGHFFTRYVFGDDRYPVVRDEVRVRLPKDRPLKFATANGRVETSLTDEGATRLYHWFVLNRPGLPLDDSLPSKEELRLHLGCSTFAAWEEIGRWKEKLRADCWKCSERIRRIVQDVTRGLRTPEDKARALAYWVRRRIRYVSVGPVRHDYTPHLPDEVLDNLFGDCKDTAQLLALMLREAGLSAWLVTLGALDDGQIMPDVPSPWGTHAIVLVRIDGRDHWIDTTAALYPWDFLPRDDRDRVVYLTDDKGSIRVLRTPALTPDDNRIEQATHVTIDTDGTSHCRRTAVYHGSAAVSQRDAWIEVPPGERRRLVTAELQDSNSRARLRSLTVDEGSLTDFDRDVSGRLEFDIPGHFSGGEEREGSLTDSKVWGRLLAFTLDLDRQAPLELGSPFESVHRCTVELPAAYRFDGLPHDQVVPSKWGTFRLTATPDADDPHRLALEFRTRLEKTRVERADFEAFHKFHEDVARAWRVWLNLKATTSLADAPALEKLLAAGSADAFSAATLARLYQRHNRAEDARRVLRRARLAHPDSAALWELTARTAPNLEDEEAAYREMVRRFPDEPKYAVALGATRVKRGDHAGARSVLEPLAGKASEAVRGAALYQLARSAFVQKQPAVALRHLKAAGKADPGAVHTVAAWRFRGQLYEQLGKAARAVVAYRAALAVDPDADEVLAALVRLELDAGRRTEALNHLRRYTVAVGDEGTGLARAAAFHLRLSRYEDALELAQRALDGGAGAEARRVLGLAFCYRGQYEQALPHLTAAPLDAEVAPARIRCQFSVGDLSAAEATATAAGPSAEQAAYLRQGCERVRALAARRDAMLRAAAYPKAEAAAWRRAADALVCAEHLNENNGRPDEVWKLLTVAFTGDVKLGPAYALRGLLNLEKGRLTRALADAEQGVALSPGEGRGFYVRGRVRLERSDRAALADLTRAAELTGRHDAAVLHWLAAALFQAGKTAEALAVQREAVRLRPQDSELTEQLREFERADSSDEPET